jgi:hypothetical protein
MAESTLEISRDVPSLPDPAVPSGGRWPLYHKFQRQLSVDQIFRSFCELNLALISAASAVPRTASES